MSQIIRPHAGRRGSKQFILTTELPPEQCVARLAHSQQEPCPTLTWHPWLMHPSMKPVYDGTTGRFRVRRRMVTGGFAFRTCAVATIRAMPGGSIIAGEMSGHPGLETLNAVWCYATIFIAWPILCGWMLGLLVSSEWIFLIPFIIWAAAYRLGRGIISGEAALLKRFLSQTLDAQEV